MRDRVSKGGKEEVKKKKKKGKVPEVNLWLLHTLTCMRTLTHDNAGWYCFPNI